MDFPNRLENTDGSQRDSLNDEIEEFLGTPRSPSQNSISMEFDDAGFQSSLELVALELQTKLAASCKYCEIDECDGNIGSVVRTGKNILRWYIQIYLEQRQVQRQRQSQDGCKIKVLRSPDTLSSVLRILKWSVKINKNLKLARDASLYIFYATYSHFSGDESASRGIDHLITQLAFPQICLEILMKADSVPLALSLIRTLHSMTVSFPGARRSILDAQIRCDPTLAIHSVPWAPKEHSTINFSLSCLALTRWSLDAHPTFPGENSEDKRVELVVEILNCFYAMRKGQELAAPSSGITTNNNDNPGLENEIIRILQLTFPVQPDNENGDEIISKRIEQCKLSAVSLLMDSDPSFGKFLLENGSFETLLEILKRQVDDIVDNTKVDSAATAALVPILVVLNKYSMANSVVQQLVKAFVFPFETEKIFQQNIKENQKTKMSPLDAPKDTLRGKLVVLLSWVDGYIKRCSAELMWTLCDSDSSEFTCRVGLGNALPLLNSKGLSPVHIPS